MKLLLIHSAWLLACCLSIPHAAYASQANDLVISVSVSPDSPFVSTLVFQNTSEIARELIRTPTIPASFSPDWIRARIKVKNRNLIYDYHGRLFDYKKARRFLLSEQLKSKVDALVQTVEQAHYGKAIPWEKVRHSFGRMKYATVIDLETGERFHIQRRAGSRHADVQPLTRSDTHIMKHIYQGKWSWKRRAILVEVDGIYYAASMHGMPHGAGAIRGNDFPGHFCIHFSGSSTHRRTEPDPSHSLMILKAAGTLPQTIMEASPEKLVGYFLTSLHEHDEHTLRMTTDGSTMPDELRLVDSVKKPDHIAVSDSSHPLMVSVPVRVEYHLRSGGSRAGTWHFLLLRSAPWERWRIVDIAIK
ncbi:hypothetical protein [Brevibacillus choshinensis]|uniref:Uncharacterized protein n=1 Tax=Brevibacillus choshinensis TaxID=54911 RepID=A0ABX7FXJ9_BRECH|nr:hypothetical protein [Brevibacillus choshinensis]QRG70524.1 hypothetical protein JNE38_10015 [Brevibacillus choshinensis]